MPWLQGWSGGAWRTLADEVPHRAEPRDDAWWRQFDDPVLDQLVAEAQRLNPSVRTAGLRIMEGLRLRVKDVEFSRREILVRDGKGFKDRVTMLPAALAQPVDGRADALGQRQPRKA